MAVAKGRRVIRRFVRRPRRSKGGFTIPVAVVAGFAPLAITGMNGWRDGGPTKALNDIGSALTGYDHNVKRWDFAYLKNGTLPILGGLIVHKLASRLGVNRMLAKSGIPIIRI